MLRGVCLALAAEGVVSVVGRSHPRLNELVRAGGGAERINAVPVDYTDPQRLSLGLRSAMVRHGPVESAVVWIHSTAPDAPLLVARTIAPERGVCRYFHVLGTPGVEPSGASDGRRELDSLPGIVYRMIVLGFVVERGRSRWLTDEESCAGVLSAVRSGRAETTIGTTRPWSARPQ
jgi:hypothetical protein